MRNAKIDRIRASSRHQFGALGDGGYANKTMRNSASDALSKCCTNPPKAKRVAAVVHGWRGHHNRLWDHKATAE